MKADTKSSISIVGIDGQDKAVLEAISNAPLAIQDAFVPIDLQIVPSKSKILLLGVDWLRKYNARISFEQKRETLTITYLGRDIVIPMETTQGYDVKIIEYAAFMGEVQPRSILKKNPKKVEFENLPKWEDHYAFTTKATEENPWETAWPENKNKPFEGS